MKWKEDINKDKQGPGEAKNWVREGRDPTKKQKVNVQAGDNNSRQKKRDSGDSFKNKSKDTCTKKRLFFVDSH